MKFNDLMIMYNKGKNDQSDETAYRWEQNLL